MLGAILMMGAIFYLIIWMGDAAGWLHTNITPRGSREERERDVEHQKRMKMIGELNALKKRRDALNKEYAEWKSEPEILYIKGVRKEFIRESSENMDKILAKYNKRIHELETVLHPKPEYYPEDPSFRGAPERDIPGMYWNQ